MIKIITARKAYTWNYKRMLKHLFYLFVIIYFIFAYLYASKLDFDLINTKL